MTELAARRTFAVLVDGDNAPADVLRTVLLEVEKQGEARVRLVFGSGEALKGRREDANTYGFRPVLQFAVATRKNAADIALAIAAIDLLHANEVDAFCIVSSDSDFHPLATRLREAGRFVMGVGSESTPDALKSACHRFVSFEVLAKPEGRPKPGTGPKEKVVTKPTKDPIKDRGRVVALLSEACAAAQADDGWAPLGAVGAQLRILDPGFDPRKYGRRQLWMLAKDTGLFDFRPDPPGSSPNEVLYIRSKG
jgi:uncharacterized protein (TIGR00288 family)